MNTSLSVFQSLREIQQRMLPVLYQPGTVEGSYEKVVGAIAQDILAICEQDSAAAMANILIDQKMPPTLRHATHTAVFCCVYGKLSELMSDELLSVTCAALTMHISNAQQQDVLWVQTEKMTALQRSGFESHSKLSKKALGEKKVKNSDWLNAVIQHHERVDGTGFLNMRGDAITKLGSFLGFADRFCALVLARAMNGDADPPPYLRYHVRTLEEEKELLAKVAEKLGPYIPGTLVKLRNGEVGIVLRHSDDPVHPNVVSLGEPGALTLTNTTSRDTKLENFEITEALSWKACANKFKLCSLWGYEPPIEPAPVTNAV